MPTSTIPFFTGQMPFLLPNQQCQSTEGKINQSFIKTKRPSSDIYTTLVHVSHPLQHGILFSVQVHLFIYMVLSSFQHFQETVSFPSCWYHEKSGEEHINSLTFVITWKLQYTVRMWSTKNLAPCGTDGRLLLSGFQLLMTLTLDQVIRHTPYGRASVIDFYLHTKISLKSEKLLWMD